MDQPGIWLFWLPAIVAGGVALVAVLLLAVLRERRWNRFAAERQTLLDAVAALEAENLRLRSNPQQEQRRDERTKAAATATLGGRFPLLLRVDAKYAGAVGDSPTAPQPTLQALCEHMRRHAAAHSGIYAARELFAAFLGAMAVSDFVLVQGEESAALPNAVAQALGQPLVLASADASWRGAADLLGQWTNGARLYEETHFLRLAYEALWHQGVTLLALQPLLAAAPQEYLSTLLPLLRARTAGMEAQLPARSIRLTDSAWPNDPVRLEDGALPWAQGLWLLGILRPGEQAPAALRRDAMEFHVPPDALKQKPFLVPWTQAQPVEWQHLRRSFAEAAEAYTLPAAARDRFAALEEYLAAQLQLDLGANAAAELERFAAVCLACGMNSRAALDAYLWHRALRLLQTPEPAALRQQMPALKDFLKKTFGQRGLPLATALLEGI
ncbi:MAG: hypothetical protein LBC83_06440 [Oscillospiraceae bacterium]|nr:hypothetical protein [Oscillospiraceae bacterium]